MKIKNLFLCASLLLGVAGINGNVLAQNLSELKYYNVEELIKEGKAQIIGQGDWNTSLYTRLPQEMKGNVRDAVWDLGQNSAGIAIRFSTNAKAIGAKWTLLNNFHMSHMPGTGIRGLDLYTLINNNWYFCGTAKPSGKENTSMFLKKMEGTDRDYIMYLPLYDGVTSLSIGIDSLSIIDGAKSKVLTNENGKAPIIFYGTSITQGGCASRPGMTYAALVERKLSVETINLGFSGNGRMDRVMAECIAKQKSSAVVIDCLPNCTWEIVRDSAEYFVRTIAAADPVRPVYMVSNFRFPASWLTVHEIADMEKEDEVWKGVAEKLRKEGFKNVKFINIFGKGLKDAPTGPDSEFTVDGVHLTDLGFMRMAEFYSKLLK